MSVEVFGTIHGVFTHDNSQKISKQNRRGIFGKSQGGVTEQVLNEFLKKILEKFLMKYQKKILEKFREENRDESRMNPGGTF